MYMKIAEPRNVRLMYFVMYLAMTAAGVGVYFTNPSNIQSVLGDLLLNVLGIFVGLGGFTSAVAVLPGVWWLERVGITLLGTGLTMYLVVVIFLGSSATGVAVSFAIICSFAIRWFDIKDSMLAPKEE